MPVHSPHPDVDIPDVCLWEYLFGAGFGKHTGSAAFVDGVTGRSVTFGELSEQVLRVAAALAERGIGRGDVVAVFARNSLWWPAVFHGVLRANAVVTAVNTLNTAGDLATQLADAGARMLVTTAELLDRAEAAATAVGLTDDAVVVLDGAPGHPSGHDLLACTGDPPALTVGPGDTAVLPYSSGTSGRPKGVILTHRNLVANLAQIRAFVQLTPGTGFVAVLPLFHIYGMSAMLAQGIQQRAAVVVLPRFDLVEFLRTVARYRPQRLHLVPPILLALAQRPAVDDHDLSSVEVVYSAAAPLGAGLARAVEARMGCRVVQAYGLTETSPATHFAPDGIEVDVATVGPLLPNMEAMVVDPATGTELPPGELGELWCRGPNVMAGYLNAAEATAATLDDDGWLHTGDLVTVDANGVFTIVDRLKELIKYKGYQVPPAELEALLLSHDRVADAAVIGVRYADGEEVPKAFVVPRPGTHLNAAEVVAFVAERVAPYKKVRVVEFVDAIPKAASGKILRRELRAHETATIPTSSPTGG
jgi:acyl-CoA synthetase (AMP-forming)/AMP-acid ligase II